MVLSDEVLKDDGVGPRQKVRVRARRPLRHEGASQLEDGLWDEEEFTGTGFPEAFYLRYHYYARYFPILALSAYRNALGR